MDARRSGLVALFLSLSALAATNARADVIDESQEPIDCGEGPRCPEGSVPIGLGHSGCPSYCMPTGECTTATDCLATAYGVGARCVPTRFCIVPRSAGPAMSDTVVDSCDAAGPCGDPSRPDAHDAHCSETSRCVPAPGFLESQRATPARGGCSACTIGGPKSAPLSVLLAALALGWAGARRARRVTGR